MIEKASVSDAAAAAELAMKLWPGHTAEELREEFSGLLAREDAAVFLAVLDGTAVGFAQCQLRHDYVEGTGSSPVGYLEGIFVAPAYQKQGIARALLASCEKWAKEQGCVEFASDCELDNGSSHSFHLKSGFREANRIICFVKEL